MAAKGSDTPRTTKKPGQPGSGGAKPPSAEASNPKQPDQGKGRKAPGEHGTDTRINPPKTPY